MIIKGIYVYYSNFGTYRKPKKKCKNHLKPKNYCYYGYLHNFYEGEFCSVNFLRFMRSRGILKIGLKVYFDYMFSLLIPFPSLPSLLLPSFPLRFAY